jgi:signal transduction histidine kinase
VEWATSLPRFSIEFPFKSIIARIIFLHVAAVGVICILMPLMLYWLLALETEGLHEKAMLEHADVLAGGLTHGPSGTLQLDLPQKLRNLYSETYGRYAFSISAPDATDILSSRGDHVPIFPDAPDMAHPSLLQARRGDAVLSGISVTKVIDGTPYRIQVAENLQHNDVISDDIVSNFMRRVAWITLPILLLMLLIDILIFRRALFPLTQASREAARIGPSQTDVRLPTARMPTEVLVLVQAVNQALDRLEDGLKAQREFAANAAHELRTPLAILRTRLDTAAETAISDAVRSDVDRMTRVVNQLLDLAELETTSLETSEETDLHSVCAEVVEYMAPLVVREGKQIAFVECDAPVRVKGNGEMLFRAVRNLAENASSHSPKGATVEIILDPNATITVLDEGPGVRDEDRKHIFERFWRGDRKGRGRFGLGLSIVRHIVEAHGGTIEVNNRTSGGASFSLSLGPALIRANASPTRLH